MFNIKTSKILADYAILSSQLNMYVDFKTINFIISLQELYYDQQVFWILMCSSFSGISVNAKVIIDKRI